jgi:hypothetical protein
MPQFKVKAPDGSIITVNGPDGGTEEQAIEFAKKQYQQQDDSGSTVGDMATSFGRGVAKGTIGLAGLPGDIASGLNKGIDYLTGQTPPKDNSYALGTSQQFTRGVEGMTGKFQEPKTRAGRYAQSVGEFLPSSAIGPGGKLLKAATTLGGGVGAQAGGEVGEDIGGETGGNIGRFIGGMAGGTGAGLTSDATRIAKLPKQTLKGADEIKEAASAGYKAAEDSGLVIPKSLMDDLNQDIEDSLKNFRHYTAPSTFNLINELKVSGASNIGDIINVRNALNKIHPAVNAPDAEAASHVKAELDSFLTRLSAPEAKTLKTAAGNWGAAKKLEEIEKAQTVAGHRAAATGTHTNEINTMRQEIRKILDSDKRVRGYRPDERAQMERIVEGSLTEDVLRRLSRLEPGGGVSAWGNLIAAIFSLPLAIGGAATGYGARKLGDVLGRRDIEKLAEMIQNRAPLNAPYAVGNAKIRAARKMTPDNAKVAALRAAAAEQGNDQRNITVKAVGPGAAAAGYPQSPAELLDNPSGIPVQ